MTTNLPLRIYINKIRKNITFQIILDLLTPATMKLLGKTRSKICCLLSICPSYAFQIECTLIVACISSDTRLKTGMIFEVLMTAMEFETPSTDFVNEHSII